MKGCAATWALAFIDRLLCVCESLRLGRWCRWCGRWSGPVVAGGYIDMSADVLTLELNVHRPCLKERLPGDLVRDDTGPEASRGSFVAERRRLVIRLLGKCRRLSTQFHRLRAFLEVRRERGIRIRHRNGTGRRRRRGQAHIREAGNGFIHPRFRSDCPLVGEDVMAHSVPILVMA